MAGGPLPPFSEEWAGFYAVVFAVGALCGTGLLHVILEEWGEAQSRKEEKLRELTKSARLEETENSVEPSSSHVVLPPGVDIKRKG
jgi:hypothetical protein